MLLEGLFLPLTTPFYLDGRLNLRKLEHNVDRYSRTPAAGLAVLSEHGDATLLTEEETRHALQFAIGAAASDKVMLAGIARDSVVSTVEVAAYAAGLSYDAVLLRAPSFLTSNDVADRSRLLLSYFSTVADQSPLPLVLASSWERSLPVKVVAELAGHTNVIGLVDAGRDVEVIAKLRALTIASSRAVTVTNIFSAVTGRMLAERDVSAGATFISADTLGDGATALAVAPPRPALRTRTKSVGFQILGGSTHTMLAALNAGAVGAMPPFGASAPQACYEVLAAWKDGNQPLAQEKQARVQSAAVRIERELGSAGIRYGCDLNGYFGGRPRLPMLPVTGAQRQEIELLMRAIRN